MDDGGYKKRNKEVKLVRHKWPAAQNTYARRRNPKEF